MSACRWDEPCDQAKQRGLSAPGRADKRNELAFGYGEFRIVQCDDRAISKGLPDIRARDNCGAGIIGFPDRLLFHAPPKQLTVIFLTYSANRDISQTY